MRMKTHAFLLMMCIGVLLAGCQDDQKTYTEPAPAPVSSSTDAPKPNKGKTVAGVAEDYESTNRVIWQKKDMVLELLGDLDNKTVADIGAGTGFFTLPLVEKAKKVIAIDIDRRFISYLDSIKVLQLSEDMQPRLETRLATPNDPRLRAGEVDIIVIVNTFMYIEDQPAYLQKLKNALADNGRLLIIDFKRKRTPIGPPSDIRVPLHVVEDRLYAAGYRNITADDTSLDYQYILLAQK